VKIVSWEPHHDEFGAGSCDNLSIRSGMRQKYRLARLGGNRQIVTIGLVRAA
jgi:hypothetical protein